MSADSLLLRGTVITPRRRLEDASLLVHDGRVAWIRPGRQPAPGVEVIEAGGGFICPGFVELQTNGYSGNDAAEGHAALTAMSQLLPSTGVTAFLPTLISSPPPDWSRFVAAAATAQQPGARILGAHVEGPFLNPRQPGVHELRYLLAPSRECVDEMLRAAPRMVTIAPELPGALEAIRRLRRAGVLVSIGHSAATLEEARAGFDAGATFVTHLFNAMSSLEHRWPGLTGATLAEDQVSAGLIADGIHIHPLVLDLAVRLKGAARLALTSDQTGAAGAPPGRYRLGGVEVVSDGSAVRLANGRLAGSAATMGGMVRVLAGRGHDLRLVVEMATLTPARVLGERRMGRLAAGLPADLVVLGPDLEVRLTIVSGRVRFRA